MPESGRTNSSLIELATAQTIDKAPAGRRLLGPECIFVDKRAQLAN